MVQQATEQSSSVAQVLLAVLQPIIQARLGVYPLPATVTEDECGRYFGCLDNKVRCCAMVMTECEVQPCTVSQGHFDEYLQIDISILGAILAKDLIRSSRGCFTTLQVCISACGMWVSI